MTLNKTLYEKLGYKRENSILKSVFITSDTTSEGYPIVIAEAYDQTFINATTSVSKYNDTIRYIMKKIHANFNEDIWLIVYTENFYQSEILVNDFYMKEYNIN